ncbi:MAG: aminopeptidase P family protein [Bacteroidales bacterium]|nr:aminopeptidase P family protein [Bacteroidales bacterium]MCF8332592.1 aminopeptidase P family protein [Bacteroidales bacterium]
MFEKKVYVNRRNNLKKKISSGLVLVLGNVDAPMNYPSNPYHFRQDSNFLYFFGLDTQGLAGVMDIDNDKDYIFGDNVDMDDIIWMGDQPTIKELATKVGVENTSPFEELHKFIQGEKSKGRTIHIYPPYRGEHTLTLSEVLDVKTGDVENFITEEVIKATVALRSIKEDVEVAELEKAADIAWEMHTTAMKMAKPGVVEREIYGQVEGVSLSRGGPVSFPVILTINGQILHNHYHGNTLKEGRIMVTDAGAETEMHYASDITRSVPVGGKFNSRQKDIYQIVLNANMNAIKNVRPGITNKELHLNAVKDVATGLKELGIMKGDIDEAVNQGAHAMFMPHGLGHMMGLDVHDMEGLGENYVGYGDELKRSQQFGLAGLRLAKTLQPGFVFTIEPGCYFIPKLIDRWKSEGRFTQFLNYDKIEEYKDFGGIRIEDDILVTKQGYKVLGKPIPKTIEEVEKTMNE